MRRRQLEKHRHRLSEIHNIMNSMKTLAAIEIHKLERYLASQRQQTRCIEDIAEDFLSHYPQMLPDLGTAAEVVLVIGSERGFCGDFNERLIEAMEHRFSRPERENVEFIIVGSKLATLLQTNPGRDSFLAGADVVEAVDSVLDGLVGLLASRGQTASLFVLHHDVDTNEVVLTTLLPPFREISLAPPRFSTRPGLNLPATDFFLQLVDHYLFSALHQILHASLMSENQQRIQHLERGIRHLDDRTEALGHRINALRQEEIIEEIEVILLNAAVGQP